MLGVDVSLVSFGIASSFVLVALGWVAQWWCFWLSSLRGLLGGDRCCDGGGVCEAVAVLSADVVGFDRSVVFVASSLSVVPMVGGVVCAGAAAVVMIDNRFAGFGGLVRFPPLQAWASLGALLSWAAL